VANDRHRLPFDLSWRSIVRVLSVVLLIWLWFHLWQLVMLVLVSVIIAVALDPAVVWLERRRVPRWVASSGSVLLLFAIAAGMVVIGWATIESQSKLVVTHLKTVDQQVRSSPVLRQIMPVNGPDAANRLTGLAGRLAGSALRAAMLVTIGLILTVYLLIEWKQTLEWILAFFSQEHRVKLRKTITEARATVSGYVIGNVVTSIFATCVVFLGLTLLHVPAALVLALLAGLFDFVPVLGFVLSGAPAVILAATVSTTTAVAVVVLYLGYHLCENYVIAPRVYGGKLEMSNLAVLLAFAVGAELGGVIGALVALPIAATYPSIEHIWLRKQLGEETVSRHERLAG
jgi:predicted PurR-regulated permease PerM